MTPGPLIVADGDVLAIDERLARLLTSRRGKLAGDEVGSVFAAARRPPASPAATRERSAAIIVIRGFLQQHSDLWGFGVSTEAVRLAVRTAARTPEVGSIVLDIDSPGGSAYGLAEAADEIRRARVAKPVIAAVNSRALSGAYWLASAASEIVLTPGGEVGSVGVYMMHVDESRALDRAGLTATLIASDPTKVFANPFEPLSDAARARLERDVQRVYLSFARDVAQGRGIDEGRVRQGWKALIFGAAEAVALGLADRIAPFDEAVSRAAELGKARAQIAAGRTGLMRIADSEAERSVLRQRFRMADADQAPHPLDRLAARAKLAGLGVPVAANAQAVSNEDLDRRLAAARLRAL